MKAAGAEPVVVASVFACDFLTVETALLQRICVLFFISLETRRIEYIACASHRDGRWVAQQARNLVMLSVDKRRKQAKSVAVGCGQLPS